MIGFIGTSLVSEKKQEAQGLGALLDKMEDNDHINWITQIDVSFTLKQDFWKSEIHRMTPEWP